jgi:hypothetical protein
MDAGPAILPVLNRMEDKMGIGVSLLLVAVGAVLAFAVNATVNGLDLVTVGWILMIVGGVGVLLSLIFWSSWGGFAGSRRDTTIVERDRTLV